MITPNRLQHILGVARKAKTLAQKFAPQNKTFAEDMFLLGFLHDIGYEFAEHNINHASIGNKLLKRNHYKNWQAVAKHGNSNLKKMSDELFILDCADMTVDSKGLDCSIRERLEDIASRYGKTPKHTLVPLI